MQVQYQIGTYVIDDIVGDTGQIVGVRQGNTGIRYSILWPNAAEPIEYSSDLSAHWLSIGDEVQP